MSAKQAPSNPPHDPRDIDAGSPPGRRAAGPDPVWTRADSQHMLRLPIASALALMVPERQWPALSARVVDLGLVGKATADRETDYLRRFLDDDDVPRPIAEIARETMIHQRLLQLQTLRSLYFNRWQPKTEVQGLERLSRSSLRERGAIVWQTPFVFATLAGKISFMHAGYPLHHLSRYTHPFTRSRLGTRLVNPIRCIPENRYLAERIMIYRGESAKNAMIRMGEVLDAGGIVSITVGADAKSTGSFPFFKGSIHLPHGPMKLAARSNVPILPTATVLDGDRFVTTIGPPVEQLSELATFVRDWTQRYPEQQVWRTSLFKPPTDGSMT